MLASFGIGNMTQANSVAANVNGEWNVAEPVTGAVMVVLAAVVIVGGIKSLGRVTSFLVPVMIVVYILGAASVLALNIGESPAAFGVIFTDAFTGTAATGGFAGAAVAAAIRYGVARGIFSNESGLGTGGIAAAAAKTTHPARQALVSMTQTFIDTLVVCSITGLVILTSVLRHADNVELAPQEISSAVEQLRVAEPPIDPLAEDYLRQVRRSEPELVGVAKLARWQLLKGSEWTSLAFRESLPVGGALIVSVAISLFAFSTILGWGYYGERSIEYLAGPRIVRPYRVVFALMVLVGPLLFSDSVWLVSDITNGLMALPNLIGLLLLWKVVTGETRAYFGR